MNRAAWLRRGGRLRVLACLSLLGLTVSSTHAEVTISDLSDIVFGEVPPTIKRLRVRDDFCVAMDPRGTFNLRGQGDTTDGDFALRNGANDRIRYQVKIRNRVLTPGVLMPGLRGRPLNPNGRCISRHRLEVEINRQDLQSAPGGAYRGTLELMVVPE